jgi:sugar O-acyltransferase (sialic acid O-acetyltransferase NeuD family)
LKPLVIFGAGEFAHYIYSSFVHDAGREVAGFCVDRKFLSAETLFERPVVAFEEVGRRFPPERHEVFVAIGYDRLNQIRAEKLAQVESKGYPLATFRHTTAYVAAGVEQGPNSFIGPLAGIETGVTIGPDSILFSGCRVGQESHIGTHCWMTNAILGSRITIGDYSFVGINATIKSYVKVAERCIIGTGALITRDTRPEEVYRGEPSRASRVPSSRIRRF